MSEEIFPLVDEDGNVIGQATRSVCHNGSKLLHPVIHLHIFNARGDLFLQKRSSTKDIQPNKWDSSVAGHIDLGETPIDAMLREAKEELSIKDFDSTFVLKYIIETDREKELSYCYYTIYNGEVVIDPDEISEGRFWSIDEIKQNLDKGIFTFNFEQDFNKFLSRGINNILSYS